MQPFDTTQRSINRTAIDNETILSGQYWGELRVFLAVAKSKSYSKAAELLGASQPTVSRSVRRLQDVVGAQLVISNRQGVILTPAGERLAMSLATLDQKLFDITTDLRAENTEAEGHVRISITDGLNALFLAPALHDFTERFPKIQISLKNPQSMTSLRDNQTDMMVGFMPAEASDMVVCRLGTVHLIPMATLRYIEKHGVPTPNNIQDHICIQSEYYSGKSGHWDPWLNIIDRCRTTHFCDHIFSNGMLVKCGGGIGIFGNYMSLDPQFVALDLGVHIRLPLYAIALRERLASRPVQLAFDWISQIFGPENPWLADELTLKVPEGPHNDGVRILFNV